MENLHEKQSRFFCGNKNELLQLLFLFPTYTICNSYAELSPYYPCLFLGEIFKDIGYENTVFFIISDKEINDNFIYINEEKLQEILCNFFQCKPPFKSNEPFFSLIYKYSIYQDDVRCIIPTKEENTMFSILNSIEKIKGIYFLDETQKFLWNIMLNKIKYSFLKTGNQSLSNYIILLQNILREVYHPIDKSLYR